MAVKIVRQPRKIALIGAPTSAAALTPGHERAPAALREAGLVAKLTEAGFEVTDLGDSITQTFQPDDEHPRARNVAAVVAVLNDLRPRVEHAVKSGALPLIVGGDCSIALATVAGARRYYRHVDLVYVDGDADLNVPATTPSGCTDGMVVSHVIGMGAPELVRFWGETPLVREPDIVLFGFERLDPAEEVALSRSPMRRFRANEVRRAGAANAAQSAIRQMHGGQHEFVLHFDVDTISGNQFSATNFPSTDGLNLDEARDALRVFAAQKNLAAFEVTAYNPQLDPDGSSARALIELIVSVLSGRLVEEQPPAETSAAISLTSEPAAAEYRVEPNPPENIGEGEAEQPSEPAATPESD
ncbi:MAG TPA: arginase family protein [Candidatus Acidoferrales bacterium]|nr:arginase family protein [Candidatus Acidoferrales bacterium]